MVAGAVSPPRIDLANEDLLRAHVHAIWLAEARVPLGSSLRDILDLAGEDPTLELLPSVREGIRSEHALERARVRSQRILQGIRGELAEVAWYDDEWLDRTLNSAVKSFDQACERWRDLFRSAARQQAAQNRIIKDHSRSAEDKKRARRLRYEAESQLELLTETQNVVQADFYSYRYFSSEGFLPGYNFPRLPLSAYLPGRRGRQGRDEFLSRPRFLAISEFGPRAIVYHEGARYLINQVILGTERVGDSDEIATSQAKLCDECGYLHDQQNAGAGPDICERCGQALGAPIVSLFRLQNVSTRRRDRISSDEEERLRLGYELKTGVRFERRGGQLSARTATVSAAEGEIARLTYGDAARLWRINLGWRRRARREELGFMLDVERGYWARNQQELDESEDPMSKRIRRVVPFVEDHRNCLLLELSDEPDVEVMASLQAALKHAIQVEFQLEDMELSAEPLPGPDDRHQLLFCESAEGGAGVLRRLVDDPRALSRVARAALEICHFDPSSGEDRGQAPRARERCEAACYDCLMSYMNQPDHQKLDRWKIRDTLLALRDANVASAPAPRSRSEHLAGLMRVCESDLERSWLQYLEGRSLNLPSHAQRRIEECNTRPDFLYSDKHTAIYVDGPQHQYSDRRERDREQTELLEDSGYTVLRFGADEEWAPLVGRYPGIFGVLGETASLTADRNEGSYGGYDSDLFPPDWRELLGGIATTPGVEVEPGADVTAGGRVVGRYVAAIDRADAEKSLRVVDSRGASNAATVSALEASGYTVVSIDPTDGEAERDLRRALELGT
jgi:very-short-patch-repair endonuclease